jgi:predicted amidophosphoribosyltransferase
VPVTVVSFAQYLTRSEQPWRQDDWHSSKFIKAIKGEPVNGYALVPVSGIRRELRQANAGDAADWFGEMAAEYLRGNPLKGSLVFVPIPNSSCTVKSRKPPSTYRLAEAIVSRLKNAIVWDGLRLAVAMQKSRQGGTRDPQEIYDNLRITQAIPKDAGLVLVDDVRTTGAHMLAAHAKLIREGGKVLLGICAGRTTWEQEPQPFAVATEGLEDFTPA